MPRADLKKEKQSTVKEFEFGVRYPDGTIEWFYDGSNGSHNILTRIGRLKFEEDRRQRLAMMHVIETEPLEYVNRVHTHTYSAWTPFDIDEA